MTPDFKRPSGALARVSELSVFPLINGALIAGYVKLRDGKMFGIFRKSPPALKAAAVLLHCVRSFYLKWRSEWKAAIERSDLIIVGGGQLFCDVALNFPIKLFLLSTLLGHKETIVLSVGVSARWSKLGKFLIERFLAMARPRFMATRDDDSADNLRRMLGHRKIDTAIIHDPALVCADAFPNPHVEEKHWDVGICISNLDALVMNSEYTDLAAGASTLFFPRLADSLAAHGKSVVLFTNGAAEDNATARTLVNEGFISERTLLIPSRPTELVSIISRCRAVVAHRLHANIVAYGQGIPSVALDWDKKVESFLRLTDRSRFLFPLSPDTDAVEAALLSLLDSRQATHRLAEPKHNVITAIHSAI